MESMADDELTVRALIGWLFGQSLDSRVRRADQHPLDHSRYRCGIAGYQRLDAAIRAIAHPTRKAKLIRLFLRPGTKEDALDSAVNGHATGDRHRHTVAMSGASSAFIPTTL